MACVELLLEQTSINITTVVNASQELQLVSMSSEKSAEEVPIVKKARYCVKCKTYMSVACFALGDGTTHASMYDRHEPYKKSAAFLQGV